MIEEDFENMGVEIDFIPFGNNPEDEISGYVFSIEQVDRIRKALFGDKK